MRPWPALRAALITLALLVSLVEACPVTDVRVADDEGGARVPAAVGTLARVQRTALTPFRFIGDGLRLTQRWRLFPVANPDRYRMVIEARTGPAAEWRLLYRPHDPEHTWLSDALEYRRLRGAWNPGTRRLRGAYPYFVTWVARTTFARAPEYSEVRVRMEQLDLHPRADDPTGATGRFLWAETRRRGELAP